MAYLNKEAGENAYGGHEWVKLFKDGKDCYSDGGDLRDVIWFDSHQDCLDF